MKNESVLVWRERVFKCLMAVIICKTEHQVFDLKVVNHTLHMYNVPIVLVFVIKCSSLYLYQISGDHT